MATYLVVLEAILQVPMASHHNREEEILKHLHNGRRRTSERNPQARVGAEHLDEAKVVLRLVAQSVREIGRFLDHFGDRFHHVLFAGGHPQLRQYLLDFVVPTASGQASPLTFNAALRETTDIFGIC